LRGQNDLRLSGSRKNAVAFKRPNGLFKSALMHKAVKGGRKDDEPAFLSLSASPEDPCGLPIGAVIGLLF